MRLVLLAGLLATFCNPAQGPTPAPGPTGTAPPVPTVTVPEPPPLADAGSGAPDGALCERAYSHMWDLHCPPREDAHGGWLLFDCPLLTTARVNTIATAKTCDQTR